MAKKKTSMNWKEWYKTKLYGMVGMPSSQENPYSPKYTFVNDYESIHDIQLREYNIWYHGDSQELLNFYTEANAIEYNYEPYYQRNKQEYFWAVSSTEGGIKRTHSGQPRNVVDTLVNIVGLPHLQESDDKVNKKLQEILKVNKFNKTFLQQQLPLTLVEGDGCWKIDWDFGVSDLPILTYYRASACEFFYIANRIVAVTFKNYYFDENGQKYLLLETRRHEHVEGQTLPNLIIEKELFAYGQGKSLTAKPLNSLPQLKDVKEKIRISEYSGLLAVPCIIYEDNTNPGRGRSIYTGKIDLFDDLDQVLSQSSNTVRRSTTREYFNSNYLERDEETGMPIQPKAFDRKYTLYEGGKSADGSLTGDPVQVTQPQLNFTQYDAEAQHILLEVISGIMSPATLGIDIAKKDNAEAQREKEKVTIFTRNTIITEEMDILEALCVELLCANEVMHTGKITTRKYEISVKFDEFADASFEAKLESLLIAFNADVMTPELFIEKLYKDSLSEKDKKEQIDYIKSRQQAAETGGMDPAMLGMMGAAMGGMNEYDQSMQNPGNSVPTPTK